ncbi:MAG: hypothetical protein V7637_2217 [Mycobacteriales bacterium]
MGLRPTRVVLVATVAGALAALVGGINPAAAAPAPTGKEATPGYQLAGGPACGLRASASKTHDEWLSCLSVAARLDRAPSVGETATLQVTVQADAKLGASDIRAELPANLAWAQAPAGFAVAAATSAEPERAGTLSVAHTSATLAVGQPATYTGVVRAVRPGAAQIEVRATAGAGGDIQAGSDDVFLTIAEKGRPSRLDQGLPAGADAVAGVAAVPTTARGARQPGLVPRSVGTAGLPKPTGGDRPKAQPNAPCDTRVTGNWSYTDQNGVWHNALNFQVQVWDQDSLSPDDLLAVGVTDGNGNYNICFDSNADGGLESGTADVYVRFVSEVSQWKVQRGGSPLTFGTGVTSDIAPGSTLNLGGLTSGDPTLMRGLHAYDEADDAWLWIPKPVNGCFDQNDGSCRQLVVNWAPDSVDGTYYSTGSNDVHLAADDPNARNTVVHEIGHAIMDDVYNDAFPAAPNCNPHSIQGTSSAGCAWTEGWAEWFPSTVYNDPFFRWPSGASLDLENASWGNGWGEGDTTEGRIAGAMIDITDGANEPTWDRYGEGASGLWFTFTHHISNNLAQFWASRAADGFNTADSGALADLYQNTVDYGFRDPLGNYAPLNRPKPTPPHNYSYNSTSNYWSVVGLRPPAGSDYDLQVWDDRAQTVFLGSSAFGGSTVDFVAVDSNLRALGDYYPRVQFFAGPGGQYQVELAQGTSILNGGSLAVSMGSGNVVNVQDTFLTAGVPATFSATPSNGGQNPELFLMADDPANPASFVQGRPSAAAVSTGGGAGAAEHVTYTPTRTGWFGLVLVNAAGSGTYTLTRA